MLECIRNTIAMGKQLLIIINCKQNWNFEKYYYITIAVKRSKIYKSTIDVKRHIDWHIGNPVAH